MNLKARIGDRLHKLTITRRDGAFAVEVDGVEHLVDAHKLEGDFYSMIFEGRSYEVSVETGHSVYRVRHGAAEQVVTLADPSREGREVLRGQGHESEAVTAVMPGRVARVLVAEGQSVEEGEGLVVLEAMKMENEIASPRAGRIKAIEVAPGQAVESGARLVVLES